MSLDKCSGAASKENLQPKNQLNQIGKARTYSVRQSNFSSSDKSKKNVIVLGNLIFSNSQEDLKEEVEPGIPNIHIDEREFKKLSHYFDFWDF